MYRLGLFATSPYFLNLLNGENAGQTAVWSVSTSLGIKRGYPRNQPVNADECRAFTVSDRSAFPEWVGGPAYLFDLLQGNQDLFLEVYT